MNPSVVLKTICKPFASLSVVAGALMLASCYTPPPPMMGPPFGAPGQPRFGYNGTISPNYPAENRPSSKPTDTPPKIVRDPRDTTVDISPPSTRTNPGSTTTPSTTGPLSDPTPPSTSNPEPPKPPPAVKEDLPYGIPVVGKKGMVYSPFAPEKGQVDVDGYKRGTRVECPYTGKHFRVP